jgi:5-methylcytosine-specific restriction enzyme subunit McrC
MLERKIAHDLQITAQRMGGISDIRLERSAFARVQLHRNSAYYDLVLKVAALAFDCLLPDPISGTLAFQDILRDERKMAKVFEHFVRNFYRSEQSAFDVLPLSISWDAEPISVTGAGRLPSMITDVYLEGPVRRIIIDTKYYANSLQKSFHGSESYHSGNLYQLFAYLKNAAGADERFASCEGMLLYPQVGEALLESYEVQGHPITIATIDLAQPWRKISDDLLQLVAAHPPVLLRNEAG